MLLSHGIPHSGVRNVTAFVQEHHYQLACQKYFEITHGVNPFTAVSVITLIITF